MKDPVREICHRLPLGHPLEHQMRRIVTKAYIGTHPEHFPPYIRCRGHIVPPGPLILRIQHGTVFNGNTHSFFLRQLQDRRPRFLHQRDVLIHCFIFIFPDKGRYKIHLHHGCRKNHFFGMLNGYPCRFRIIRQHVGKIPKTCDSDPSGGRIIYIIFCFFLCQIFHVNMRNSGISAVCSPFGPAAHLQRLKTCFCSIVHHFLIVQIGKNRRM